MDLEHELWSLAKYRALLEEQLVFLREQELLRARAAQDRAATDEGERDLALQQVEILVYEVLPRFYRGPFLISLWAVFESGVIEVAEYIRKTRSRTLKLRDIRGRDKKEEWDKYFTHVLNYPLGVEGPTWQQLDELRQVRNVLAHANGRLDLSDENTRQQIERWCAEGRGLSSHYGLLLFSEEYTRQAQVLVTEVLSSLTDRVRTNFAG